MGSASLYLDETAGVAAVEVLFKTSEALSIFQTG